MEGFESAGRWKCRLNNKIAEGSYLRSAVGFEAGAVMSGLNLCCWLWVLWKEGDGWLLQLVCVRGGWDKGKEMEFVSSRNGTERSLGLSFGMGQQMGFWSCVGLGSWRN
jgi:hypothetical protein